MSSYRHSLIPAVYVVFRKNDHVLLLRRFNTGYADGMLTPPAGHVEAGEKFSQAAVREAAEEVGVIVDEKHLEPLHVAQRRNSMGQERIDIYFIAHQWQGEILNKEPHKCSELVWAPISNLPEDLLLVSKRGLELGLQGIFYSELWE